MILFQPELEIGKQKMQDLRLVIVEALRAPGRMIAPAALVEELIGGAVEAVDAFQRVAHGVGMHHVEQDAQAEAVGLVDQVLQFLGISEAGRRGEEIAHLIAEGAVIRVLHDRHQLYGIVSVFHHMGEDLIGKFHIGVDLVVLTGHSHMGFVDQRRLVAGKAGVGPGIRLEVVPNFAAPALCDMILNGAASVERQMLGQMIPVLHDGDDAAALAERVAGEKELPVAVLFLFHRRVKPVPAVEITAQIELIGPGSPFAVDPAVGQSVEAVVFVSVGKVVQRAETFAQQLLFLGGVAVHTELQVALVGLELRISLNDAKHGDALPSSCLARFRLLSV